MFISRAALVTLILLALNGTRAKPVPIGTVSSCKGAAIHGAALFPGTTIFSGDTIDVSAQGNAWIAMQGGGQVQVYENSSVLLTKSPDSIRVTIDRGAAQTNSKGVVISRQYLQDDRPQSNAKEEREKHEDRDCEVSRDSRRHKPCKDDVD